MRFPDGREVTYRSMDELLQGEGRDRRGHPARPAGRPGAASGSRSTSAAMVPRAQRWTTAGNEMNLLDKAISIVAPRVALQRVRSRVALELTTGYLERHAQRFRYEGATAGRRAHGWYAASTDANVELMGSLIWLRNRSRDLIRNNPYAARAVEELAGNVVGTGIVPKAKTGNTAIDKIIDAEWPFFADGCDTPQRLDFYGMQTLTVRTMAESGEAIVRFRPRPADAGLRIPLQLQMLEADFLDQARTMGLVNGHVMEGVQFDEMGRRVAYWLFSYHPGGVLILNPRGGIVSQPVPADQIMHVYRVLRPGQVRGVPWLAPVMMALRDLDDYCDAERVRKKVEACVTAFVAATGRRRWRSARHRREPIHPAGCRSKASSRAWSSI